MTFDQISDKFDLDQNFTEEVMASIFKRPSGTWTVELYVERDRKTKIGLATKSQREARRIADRIQALADSRKTGIENQDCVAWLVKVRDDSPKLYKRLVELNLAQNITENLVTLEMLESAFIAQQKVSQKTLESIQMAFTKLKMFFGDKYLLNQITPEMVERFVLWLHTPDANLINGNKCLSENTISISIRLFRRFCHYAVRLGWISQNYFIGIRANVTPAFKKWYYISHEEFQKMLDGSYSQVWRTILCLGRYAGCRGSSELYNLTWNMIHFAPESTITLRATKKEGKQDELRTIPMCYLLESELIKLKESSSTENLFPKMHRHVSFYNPLQIILKISGLEGIPEPWYNLRRSFCSDLMESGIDPKLYESVCGHGFEVGMRHYQILHPDRQRSGFEKIRKIFPSDSSGDNSGDKKP